LRLGRKIPVIVATVLLFSAIPASLPPAAQDAGTREDGIRRQVDGLLKDSVLHGASVGILVKSLKTGKVLYRRNSEKLFVPASTNKIITGAAALETLGPKFKFNTQVYVDPPLGADGTVNGNLYIKGFGDPSLVVEETWLLAHQIHGHGVRSIAGDVVGDDSFFEATTFYESWGFKSPRSYAAPMGALSFNWNTLQAYVAPGLSAGAPAHVTLNPEGDYFQLENHVKTCGACRTSVRLRIKDRRAIVTGKIGIEAEPQTAFASISAPLPHAVNAIKALLKKEGVEILGVPRAGIVPETARLLFIHESRDLSLIIRYLYRFSNNFTAEQIQKTMGAQIFGGQATREKGCDATLDYMKKIGAFQPGIVIEDGSGLSRENRQSPESLVKVLTHVAETPEIFPEFLEAMAIGGVDGTIQYRFKNTRLEKRLRAKTGYLYGVVTLAGYAWNTEGEPFAFAIMINDPPAKAKVREVKWKLDAILLKLMQ